jgi:phosphate transporter
LEKYIGGTGIVGMIPVVLFFGTGILSKKEFKELPWDVLMLLAGGMVLGDAISDPEDPTDSKSPARGLLVLIANNLSKVVEGAPVMAVNAAFSTLMFIVGNFVSHTVSAIILVPVIWGVGTNLGNGDPLAGHAPLLVMSATLIDSGAMGLPVSSFPNAQMYSETDKHGKAYLTGTDFMKTGFLIGILETAFLTSVGYYILLGFGL